MRIVFAQVFLFLSYFSSMSQSKKIIHSPNWLKNNQTASKIKHVTERNYTPPKKLTLDDFKTLMQIWATMFVFTFPIIVLPYNSHD